MNTDAGVCPVFAIKLCLCLCPDKRPWTEVIEEQKFIFSQFWRREAPGQGAGVASGEGALLGWAGCHLRCHPGGHRGRE